MPTPIYIYFSMFSILAGITLYFQHGVPLYLKLIPVFLLISIGVEYVGFWMFEKYGSSIPLFNFYLVFNLCFYLYVLREIITDKIFRRVALFAIIAYLLFTAANIFYIQGMHTWNSMSYSLGCLLIVGFCIYYFLELFKRPKSTRLTREPAFWIVSGLLFFYCCSLPFLGLNNFLNNAPHLLIRNLSTILTLLNILLYLLFSIAFLCKLRPSKPTL